jgi:hypothetical protein
MAQLQPRGPALPLCSMVPTLWPWAKAPSGSSGSDRQRLQMADQRGPH